MRNRHEGPLRLLKSLLSEDERRLEAVIVHPPGGLVGGDSLLLDLHLGAGARVLATTPGAQKWYRGDTPASACTRLTLAAGASLEWLPQPAILFNRALARQSLAIDLAADACCVGWEVLIRGRGAMGETLESGHIDQTLSITVAQTLLWQERLHAHASDRLFSSPLGWNGRCAAASVWCCAPAMAPDQLVGLRDRWRALLGTSDGGEGSLKPGQAHVRGGATLAAGGLLLAKLLTDDSERLMSICRALWRAARMSLEGDGGSLPRIWRT